MAELTPRTKGETLEGIAFQFCKVATVALVAGRWTLPVASLLCAVFFVAAYRNGKKDTRCALRHPLLAAAIFTVVGGVSLWLNLGFGLPRPESRNPLTRVPIENGNPPQKRPS